MEDELKDRGTIKWTAIMLPEHVKMLKEMFAEDEKIEKPLIDEQQKVTNDLAVQRALQEGIAVDVKFYDQGKIKMTRDRILFVDALNGWLRLERIKIKIDQVLSVHCVD